MKKYTCFLRVEDCVNLLLIVSNTLFLCSELETLEGKLSEIPS